MEVLQTKGTGTAEDIDLGMILSDNHPIGPLKRADLIGEAAMERSIHCLVHVPEGICRLLAALKQSSVGL